MTSAWQDLRSAALSGSFNALSSVYTDMFESAWPRQRGHTLMLPFNNVGKPLITADEFTAHTLSRYHARPAHQQTATQGTIEQAAKKAYRQTLRDNIMEEADGQFIHMDMVGGLSAGQRALDFDILALKLHQPLSRDGKSFTEAAQRNPDLAFIDVFHLVEEMAHESAHAISRRQRLPGSAYNTQHNRHTEELRATLFGSFVAGRAFGPAMHWSMRSNCDNTDDLIYFAPDIFRTASHTMLMDMRRPANDPAHFNQLELPQLLNRASHYAQRQHQSPAQREAAKHTYQQTLAFARTHTIDKTEARLSKAAQLGAAAAYGAHFPHGYTLDRARQHGEALNMRALRKSCADNPFLK